MNQTMEYKGVYRVKLTLSLISSALLLFLIAECILTSFDYIEIALITVLSLMFLLFLWLNEDTIQVVNALIIWSCTILIFYLSWLNNGIFDSAIYAYPCVILLAMFMGIAKRRGELIHEMGTKTRAALKGYNLQFIDTAMVIMASVTVVAYIMYTVSPEVVERIGNDEETATIIALPRNGTVSAPATQRRRKNGSSNNISVFPAGDRA